MKKLKGKNVLITGAAGGIGFSTAELFAKEGSNLILVDINPQKLIKVAQKLEAYNVKINWYELDVSKQNKVARFCTKVLSECGPVDVLINNAGIGYTGELIETKLSTWKKLIDINFWGPLYMIYDLLPSMIDNKSGHIVNVSSGQAFFKLPTWGAYAVSKVAIAVFSEILRYELKKLKLNVSTVYPFMTNTGFYQDVTSETFGQKLSMALLPYYSQSPETVAKTILRAVKKKKHVEKVSVINEVGYYSNFIPGMSSAINKATIMFLGKKANQLKPANNI